ncbi:MAG: lectin-like protein [Phycisphaerales bacterium]
MSVASAASLLVAAPTFADSALACGDPASGDCFELHGPFCDNAACCSAVCALDASCCTIAWDFSCVELAQLCPTYVEAGPLINPSTGHRHFLASAATWSQAQALAQTFLGNLATVNNGTENEWLRTYFASSFLDGYPKQCWIGLNDSAQEGNFVWVSGQPVTFLNWFPGQPDDSGRGEDRTGMLVNGEWNDFTSVWLAYGIGEAQTPNCPGAGSCFGPHASKGCDIEACCNMVCLYDVSCCASSWDVNCAIEAVSWCDPAVISGPIVNPATRHRYYLLEEAFWSEAERVALGLNGHLVTVNSAAENEWIRLNLIAPTNTTSAFIGFNDQAKEGMFTWVSTQPNGFTNWEAGEPNNLPNPPTGEDFGEIRDNGKWNDLPLSAVRRALVEVGCIGDLNGNNQVDGADLGVLLGAWGKCGGCAADINLDGMVDGSDLGLLLGAWGVCPTSSCCSGYGGVGCDQPGCQLCVCGIDPLCCNVQWDESCASEAANPNQCNVACQCSGAG